MHLKRIISPDNYRQAKKQNKFSVAVSPGPHSAKNSIPLIVIVRDILKYASIAKEAKKIISRKEILIDNKPRRDYKFGVGFMDLVFIPKTKEYFRAIIESKKLCLKKINENQSKEKVCKIIGKTKIKKGLIQIHLHDSRTILINPNDLKNSKNKNILNCKVGDSLLIGIPDQKIKEHISLSKGTKVVITDGKNKGQTGTITEIKPSSGFKEDSIAIKNEKETFTTIKSYVFALGNFKYN